MPTSACHPKRRRRSKKLSPTQNEKHAGYWINRRYFFLGQPLKHAYFPNWNLRLFRHKLGRYEKITDLSTDSGDHEIHEHVVVQGSTGKLTSIMDHHAFPTIDSFVEKHNRYSNWEAIVESSAKDEDSALQHEGVKGKRRLAESSENSPFAPPYVSSTFTYGREVFLMDGRAMSLPACTPNTNFCLRQKPKPF